MSSPLQQAGATAEPSEYASLAMDRQFTGIWTQRSPFRDAAVPYEQVKFYGASRFDAMIDGLNREITQSLTDKRSPGSSEYNSLFFPPALSFYPWKYIQNGTEQIRVLMDGNDGNIYDATVGQKSTLYTKSTGAGPARFLGVNTQLFLTDGVDNTKVLRSNLTWQAATKYTVGDFIVDSNGNLQSFQSQATNLTITALQIVTKTVNSATQRFLIVTLSATAPTVPSNQPVTFSGITASGYTSFNGQTLCYRNIAFGWGLNLGTNQIAFATTTAVTAAASSAGTAATFLQEDSTGNDLTGTSGATQPTWSTGQGQITQDGTVGSGVTWMCFGSPVQDWMPSAPAVIPNGDVTLGPTLMTWSANGTIPGTGLGTCLIDSNGNYQVNDTSSSSPLTLGAQQPMWNTALNGNTIDGQVTWINVGQPTTWIPLYQYDTVNACFIDPNGNLQVALVYFQTKTVWTAGVANTTGANLLTGATEPTWSTTPGAFTTDGSYDWFCCGPANQLTAGTLQYSYSYHCIDGSVTTAAPVSYVLNAVVGGAGLFEVLLQVPPSFDPQVDQIWLWRTAGGQATLVFLDAIPNTGQYASGPFLQYQDVIPDTSTNGQQALNALIPAPVADSADPPQAGMTAPVYYQNRVWAIVENQVVYSGGPDTVTGNGNTAWPPLNTIPFQSQPVRLVPITLQGGGLVVLTTGGVKIILGIGTESEPYYVADYFELVSVTGYNAVSVFYNQIFMMESNGKVSSMAIEYPFNPQSGYSEVGFPIGDQFVEVTTGGVNAALFNPATAYVSWNSNRSADTGMYVSDGAGNWFRMSLISPPESGILWSPLRRIVGGATAVQSVETVPGTHNLLIGPTPNTYITTNPIATVQVLERTVGVVNVYQLLVTFVNPVAWGVNTPVAFSGLTNYTMLNGQTLDILFPNIHFPTPTAYQAYFQPPSHTVYGPAADTGEGTVTATGGPILMRDTTGAVFEDNGTPYPAWDVKGNIVLCNSGEVAEVAHVALKSRAYGGSRPIVSLLFDEIAPTAETPFDALQITSTDPPDLTPPTTVYSDRYSALQNNVCPRCDSFQMKVDYGTQNTPDELLMFAIYGAKHSERKQQ